MQHDRWEPSSGGRAFEASRVLLGAAVHFAAVAALIAIELTRLDLSTDEALQQSFSEVEPIIELAIRRAALSDDAILGLIGELIVLRFALLVSDASARANTVLNWRGWAPGRDFVIGLHGIEVKATLGTSSRHRFSGLHQLERQAGPHSDETVHLLSLGLQAVETGGLNVPELVDDILSLLGDEESGANATQQQFLVMIASYGGPGAPSYDHAVMSGWAVYQQHFTITFARLYDVADTEMRLLVRETVEQTFVNPESLSFELDIPARLSAFNPAEDWQTEIAAMVRDQLNRVDKIK
jgi:hypothetical protein